MKFLVCYRVDTVVEADSANQAIVAATILVDDRLYTCAINDIEVFDVNDVRGDDDE